MKGHKSTPKHIELTAQYFIITINNHKILQIRFYMFAYLKSLGYSETIQHRMKYEQEILNNVDKR